MVIENKHALRKRIGRCIDRLKRINHSVANAKTSSASHYLGGKLERINSEIEEVSYLVLSYNQLKDLPEVRPCNVDGVEGKTLGQIMAYLINILRELETAYDYLEGDIKSNISQNEQSKINWAREELEKLKSCNLDLALLQNLEEAISEGESGHHLACGIISARVIDSIIQTFKKREFLPNNDLNEHLVVRLRELGILKEDEIAGQDKKEFLDAAKSARDAVSHKIEFMPNGPKASSLLSYAFIISDLFVKYKEIRKDGES